MEKCRDDMDLIKLVAIQISDIYPHYVVDTVEQKLLMLMRMGNVAGCCTSHIIYSNMHNYIRYNTSTLFWHISCN